MQISYPNVLLIPIKTKSFSNIIDMYKTDIIFDMFLVQGINIECLLEDLWESLEVSTDEFFTWVTVNNGKVYWSTKHAG